MHVRVGGAGPAVVLIHGYGDTGDMWAPLGGGTHARSHRHRGGPARHGPFGTATDGFTKKNQAEDIAGVMNALRIERADVVGHDIGNMVAFAFASAHPDAPRGS